MAAVPLYDDLVAVAVGVGTGALLPGTHPHTVVEHVLPGVMVPAARTPKTAAADALIRQNTVPQDRFARHGNAVPKRLTALPHQVRAGQIAGKP
ncbi:hypothetical protein [Kineosporia sp. NBRC 101731]|uniref:hypothetical protein n=1 Tax=Kineosporia sp. NBRC 101731 TaxID=3032199 RepID=UPI0024A48F78|nr:hypothetical protein [Kineosporia sp. NBRC 101731]GLY33210.1 hypothetical protein Kisp02_65750 [Kineosporia sp. NBRC 101731]